MSAPDPAPTRSDDRPPPRWGLGEAALAALGSLAVSIVVGSMILAAAGYERSEDAPLAVLALLQATLWIGMLGAVWLLVGRRGGRIVPELSLRFRPVDVPIGIAVGVACQLLLVPLVSGPWIWLLGADGEELRVPACRLAAKADDPFGVVLLFLITVIGASVVEELFFRGFAQRAAVARLGRPLGLAFTSVAFGLVHFQLLQLPALVAFGLVLGLLADRTKRLGSSIVAHMAFNATTVVTLVLLSDSATCDSVLGVLGWW